MSSNVVPTSSNVLTSASNVVERAPPTAEVKSSPEEPRVREVQQRDARGRILRSSPVVETADEKLSEAQVRERLKRLYAQSPHGSLAGLGRVCGYRSAYARQTLRQVAKGTGKLMEANRRRISRVLNQIERGELVCTDTGKRRSGYPVYIWEHRARGVAVSINSRKD